LEGDGREAGVEKKRGELKVGPKGKKKKMVDASLTSRCDLGFMGAGPIKRKWEGKKGGEGGRPSGEK